ncbi:MAG: NAD(P)/FAD-dependent oxidoreductase [Candidatus Geothermarchaeota archaeon]
MLRYDYLIVGGGPIGLLTGILLLRKGFNVALIEEDAEIGLNQHCTGIVSMSALNVYPIDKKALLINRFYGIRLKVDDIFDETFRASTPRAVLIDRYRLEKELEREFLEIGGKLIYGKRINTSALRYFYKDDKRYVVNAEGAKGLLIDGYRVMGGLNVELKLTEEHHDPRIVSLYVSKDLNSDFFFWVVPIGSKMLKVGTASYSAPFIKCSKFILKYFRKVEVSRVLIGFVNVDGPRDSFIKNGIVYVGDAAGMNKITTGGGLFYGGVGAHILAKSLSESNVEDYRREWLRCFWVELLLQKLMRRLFYVFSDTSIRELFLMLSKSELINLILSLGDMDFHATSILKLITDKDILIYLIKQTWF